MSTNINVYVYPHPVEKHTHNSYPLSCLNNTNSADETDNSKLDLKTSRSYTFVP